MKVSETSLKGVLIIEPSVFKDDRGIFMETYNNGRYAEAGIRRIFLQDNYSLSLQGILRGMHYQLKHPQAKLISVLNGEIFDVAVDIRQGSPSFGKWVGVYLSSENRKQIFIPEGFAHGFCVMSKSADVLYKCSDLYYSEDDMGILWSDPDIGIEWPLKSPILSLKDSKLRMLKDIPKDKLPS